MSRNPRDDLRVPAEFEATRTGFGQRAARRVALNLRAAHNSLMELEFNQVASILRYDPTGGDAAAGVKPVRTLVTTPDLSDLPCQVGDMRMREVMRAGEKMKVATREFVFYNVPEWTSPSSSVIARVRLSDRIGYLGDEYDVLEVDAAQETGANVVLTTLRKGR